MKLILDTHIWLWYALGDPKLSDNLRSIIAVCSCSSQNKIPDFFKKSGIWNFN